MIVESPENPHFCSLIIGDPGEVAALSLRSLILTNPSKVCILVDQKGKFWIEEFVQNNFWEFCLHEIQDQNSWVLDDFDSDLNYEIFGSDKFFRLMYLKWVVIKECFAESEQSNYVVFTDLDVYWSRNISESLRDFLQSDCLFALQNDSTVSRQYYCPGIMIWKKSSAGFKTLIGLMEFHREQLIEDPYLPDDKAINRWLELSNNRIYLYALPSTIFIIGHRIYHLLLQKNEYELKTFIAFHANYCIGQYHKLSRMLAVEAFCKNYHLRYYSLFKVIALDLLRRIK